ncbi:MAG TPA: hypothetical protein VG816_11840 [Solirubrobacterales bacterium]|nr:hypothetical protein [Solirubrobacterales bacterium]
MSQAAIVRSDSWPVEYSSNSSRTSGARSGSGTARPESGSRTYPQGSWPSRWPWRAFSRNPVRVQKESETE